MSKLCLQVCQDWLENVDFFEHVITGDESWIFEYDSDTKEQILEWKSFLMESHGKRKPRCKNKKPRLKTFTLVGLWYKTGSLRARQLTLSIILV